MRRTHFNSLARALAIAGMLHIGGCSMGSPADRSAAPVSLNHHNHDADVAHDHAAMHPSHDPQAACTCAAAALADGWCKRCNVGSIAGVRVESARLFETLHPHGHEIMLTSLTCESCRDAARTDGFCDSSRVGFVNQMAYFTRLTYGLALGTRIDPQSLACADCKSNMAESGWCDRCHRGMVGNVAFDERAAFDRTAQEFRVLLAAIDRVETCELCACMMVVHKTCPQCMISYEYETASNIGTPRVDPATGRGLP